MFSRAAAIAESKSWELRTFCEIAGGTKASFYRNANFTGADLRGQDLSGFDLSDANIENAIADFSTVVDADFVERFLYKTDSQPRSILVVDDIPTNVRLLEARLTAEDYNVSTAHSGVEAILACKAGPVHLILLDVLMPEMDGYEVCRRVRADPTLKHIPIVFITALDREQDRDQAFEVGGNEFYTKPIDDRKLIATISDLTRLRLGHGVRVPDRSQSVVVELRTKSQ